MLFLQKMDFKEHLKSEFFLPSPRINYCGSHEPLCATWVVEDTKRFFFHAAAPLKVRSTTPFLREQH